MYTAQLTIDRIQMLIKEKGLVQKHVLEECGINENTLKRMTDNKGMSSFSLAKIADYLNCSVDYLLGRVDAPKISKPELTGAEKRLFAAFKELSADEQMAEVGRIELMAEQAIKAKNAEIA